MKFADIHPTLTQDPWVRFFARMDEIHTFDHDLERPVCFNCQVPIPCDTMRAFVIYSKETGRG